MKYLSRSAGITHFGSDMMCPSLKGFPAVAGWIATLHILGFAAGLRAAPGDLDPAFDGADNRASDGVVDLAQAYMGVNMRYVTDLLITGNDSMWIAGDTYILHLDASGERVPGFGADGVVTLPFDVRGLVPLASGNVVAVGMDAKGIVAAALDGNGALVASFGAEGYARWATSAINGPVTGIEAADGRILIAGRRLIRLNSDGTLDTTFGDQGSVLFARSGNLVRVRAGNSGVYAYALGYTESRDLAVYAIDDQGGLYAGYGMAGVASSGELVNNLNNLHPMDFAADSRGGFVAVGYQENKANSKVNNGYVVRFNAFGQLDPEFNAAGFMPGVHVVNYKTINGYSKDILQSLVIQPDGRIVLVGQSGQHKWTVLRLNADGTLDSSFGGTDPDNASSAVPGIAYDPVRAGYNGVQNTGAHAVALDSQGRIVVAGGDADYPQNRFALRMLGGDPGPLPTSAGTLRFRRNIPSGITLSITLEAPGDYEFVQSTDLTGWSSLGGSISGVGQTFEREVDVPGSHFFQVRPLP